MPAPIITLSGSSGAGKSSYAREILKARRGSKLVISHTTRPPREKDLPGEYRHVDDEVFAREGFLWTARHHGHRYGTHRNSVLAALAGDAPSLMLIDHASVGKLRAFVRDHGGRACHFWCLAPSEDELRERLMRRVVRGDMDVTEVETRIADCRAWDAKAARSKLPYLFVPGFVSVPLGADIISRMLYFFERGY